MYIIHLSLLLFTQRQPILIFDLDDLLFYLQDTLHILFCFNVLIQYDWWRIFQCAILIIFRTLINKIDWTWCMCRKITKSYFFSQMGYHSIILSLSGLPRVISSIQFSRSVLSNSLWPHESQHARSPCPSPTPGVYSNSCSSCRWCHPAISSSVVPFSSCPQSLPASGSFPMNQLFTWGGQSIGVSASASVLSMNTQDWSPLEWTGCISLQSKGLSRVFSNTTVQKH